MQGRSQMKLLSHTSRRLATGIALASVAILVPAAAIAASAAPGTHHHLVGALPRCANAHPALPGGAFVWLGQPGNGFAGGVVFQLEITNTGRRACALRGVPRVAAVRSGHLVGAPAPGPAGPQVTLQPGATAHVPLDVGDFGAVCAHPVTASVIIYLPGRATAQSAWMTAQVCPNKPGGGVLRLYGPIGAGPGIPLYTAG
jgi:Protein of unknown function (DUF4232)